jgi:CRP-like cAMP-binding protein
MARNPRLISVKLWDAASFPVAEDDMRADFLDGIDIAGFPRQQFARGAMVVGPDAGADRLAYVAAGSVRNPASGARIGPGGVLALPEFLAESAARAPWIACEPCTVAHLPREAVRAALAAGDPITWTLARILALEAVGAA